VDSAWEQEKLEARKMLVNRADSHLSGARFVGRRCMLMRVFFHLSATIYNLQYLICLFTIPSPIMGWRRAENRANSAQTGNLLKDFGK